MGDFNKLYAALANYNADRWHNENIGNMLVMAIKLRFPAIQNIKFDAEKSVIQFDEGTHTKEEVETFINQFRIETKPPNHNSADNS